MSSTRNSPNNYILAVDDIPDNLFLVQLALEQEGHKVVQVNDGATALAQIEDSPPDLVVLDVMMPGMDGYEVTRHIRNNPNLPYIPILLITAHEESSLVEGLDVGADEFIRKPVKVDELQARTRSLLRLKKSIDERENFVACLTHDLRTPLVAVDRMLQLIKQGVYGEVPSMMDRAVSSIIGSNKNMLQMLNNLLEVHNYEAGQKNLSFIEFDLLELATEVIQELSPLAEEKQLLLNLECETSKCSIIGDRLELRRVLTNLINNAIKFTDRGHVEVRLSQNSEWTKIEVEDTGVGIPPEQQKQVFERFRQGKNRRSGHGLGLHLCRQIIQAHRGKIELQSQVKKRTLFIVSLPFSTARHDV